MTLYGTGVAGPGPVPIYWNGTVPNAFQLQPGTGIASVASGYGPGIYEIRFTTLNYGAPSVVIGGVGSNVLLYVK